MFIPFNRIGNFRRFVGLRLVYSVMLRFVGLFFLPEFKHFTRKFSIETSETRDAKLHTVSLSILKQRDAEKGCGFTLNLPKNWQTKLRTTNIM